MKNMKQLILLGLVLFSIDAFAYRLIKSRDHWGIFGGFSSVEDKKESHFDAGGNEIVDIIYLSCTGWGNDACAYMKFAGPNTDGGPLTIASAAAFDNMFTKVEQKIEVDGITKGDFNETHAIQQANGSYKYYKLSASWDLAVHPKDIVLDVQEIEKPINVAD
jgi:hypothetical protein